MSPELAAFGVVTFLAGTCFGWVASAISNLLTSRRKRDAHGRFAKHN